MWGRCSRFQRFDELDYRPWRHIRQPTRYGTNLQFLQLVISGIAQGCIYGLIALGFVLIYKATETVSFVQGDLMMLGSFMGLFAVNLLGFPFWVGVISAVLAMGARCSCSRPQAHGGSTGSKRFARSTRRVAPSRPRTRDGMYIGRAMAVLAAAAVFKNERRV